MIVLVYTHEVVSTKSERKPIKGTIWLTDQITQKCKNRPWQIFQLSIRKQQRNDLNRTVKSLNCFLYLRRKVELCCSLLTRQVYSQKGSFRVCCVVLAWSADKNDGSVAIAFFFLLTWNAEFLLTFAFKFVCHRLTSDFGPNFSC